VRLLVGGPALAGGTDGAQVVLTLPAGARAEPLPPGQAPDLLPVHDGIRSRDGRKDAMETGFALSEIDTTTPHPARMYDALLGGKDNYAATGKPSVRCSRPHRKSATRPGPTGHSCSGRSDSWLARRASGRSSTSGPASRPPGTFTRSPPRSRRAPGWPTSTTTVATRVVRTSAGSPSFRVAYWRTGSAPAQRGLASRVSRRGRRFRVFGLPLAQWRGAAVPPCLRRGSRGIRAPRACAGSIGR
jgi:S-adenosyl methyltransferase